MTTSNTAPAAAALAAATERIAALERALRGRRAARPVRPCACGCGRETQGTWAPGHDARHHARLLRDARGADPAAAAAAHLDAAARGWDLRPAPATPKERRAAIRAELEALRAEAEALRQAAAAGE